MRLINRAEEAFQAATYRADPGLDLQALLPETSAPAARVGALAVASPGEIGARLYRAAEYQDWRSSTLPVLFVN